MTRLQWKHWGLTLLLLLIFFAQGAAAIPQLSLTADEPAFIGPGYAYLQTGDLRLETSAAHPPLLFMLAAAPLLLQSGPDVTTLPGWDVADLSTFARAFVTSLGGDLEAATFAARLPVLLISLLGAALVFRWAADWFGLRAGLIALAFFVFDPNVSAHATLATTDLGLSIFGFASAYLLYRLLQHSSLRLLPASGLALGLTLGAKSSGAFALAVLIPLFFLARLFGFGSSSPSRSSPWQALGEAAVIAGLAVLVLWGLYRFELRPVGALGNLSLPFATQWETWLGTRTHAREGHTAFLMGQISSKGWWTYYPIAFLLKTPLPLLILLAAAVVHFLRQGWQRWRAETLLWVYPMAYALITLFSTIAIGYRFLLVVLPFAYVFIARLLTPRITPHASRLTLYALLAWQIVGTAQTHPHYLTYFNELAGGPEGGHRYLVDSNLDWGQSFKALRTYLDQQEIEQVWLSHYTYTDPALYGIRYRPIAPSPDAPPVLPSRFDPAPGVYVIGATTLQGVMVVDPDTYDWFRRREPVARPGTALFVYRVDPRDEPPTWLAQCTAPVAPLPAEAAQEGFGRSDLRIVYFDCTSSWLYPTGGESPGWHALFRDTARSDDAFIQARLAAGDLSYEQRQSRALPSFVIYEQNAPLPLPSLAPAAPVQVGHLTFLGHTCDSPLPARPGRTVEIATWWRVDSLPERPLSIMLHLAGPGGGPVVVGDGLGVPIAQWRVGDVIVQRHSLALPTDAPPGEYTPTTGVYWLDTMERWSAAGTPTGDPLALPTISVGAD
jgi:4-amino-4-deoxy-L-arabinose transferase-like glycosyltransferase